MPKSKPAQVDQSRNTAKIKIWDLPTRIFHWALVAFVVTSFVTGQLGGNAMQYHLWSGYTILALLLFRLIWGFVGSPTIRFASFVRGPATVLRYARTLINGDYAPHLGHNPLGGWSIVAMLAALLLQVGTGLFATDDIATQGPLYPLVSDHTSNWLSGIHVFNQGVIIALVTLPLLAVLFYLLFKRDNLITPMITGTKPWKGPLDAQIELRSGWVAVIVAAVSIAAVYLLVR